MNSVPHRFSPAGLFAWLLSVTMLAAPLASPARAQIADNREYALTQEAGAPDEAQDAQTDESGEEGFARRGGDNFKSPRAAERYKRRQEALRQRLNGNKQAGKVHQVAKGQYVELGLERNDRVFVILVEYGAKAGFTTPTNQLNAAPGPLHNQIAEPNRSLDNSTIWQPDYNRAHFADMYFNRMVDYFRTQSSGRYTINGDVTEWVKVPFNGHRYGSNLMGDAGAWTLIADAVNTWTQQQLASGKTLDEVRTYLQTFDQWDRYDYDNDGNFDEADGYIDHFQIVHSGAGEETGGGALGANAIWSHRWQAWYNRAGVDGPAFNKDGGVEFGGGWGANPTGATASSANAALSGANPTTAATVTYAHPASRTGVWVGDYTIQPENGGLGVFAHEYGHDLGLPDHYDTTNTSSNSSAYWTLMSSGSYLGDGTTDIGARPGDFGAWDKLQLGWLNYETADPSKFQSVRLGPAETNTKQAQAVVVPLPPSKNVFHFYDPAVGKLQYGARAWWGGKGDSLDSTMTRSLAVPAGASTLQMRLNYQIESGWDYAYVSVSNDGGATWANLSGTFLNGAAQSALTTNANPNGGNLGNGITGTSNNAWRLASFNMTPYAGQTVLLRLRYKTDDFVNLKGVMADEITLGGFADGAEAGDNGWTLDGFKATAGVESSNLPHYYIAEFRQYRTYDEGLKTGPYTLGRSGSGLPNWVDHFPYQDGLLVWYWDEGEANNNTSQHKGEGLVLPIDARPEPLRRVVPYDGLNWTFSPWSAPIQAFDSTFGLEPTDEITLPFTGILPPAAGSPAGTPNRVLQFEVTHPSQPAVPVFNDLNSYWSPATAASGVIVPQTGTTIRVVSTSAQGGFMQVHVGPVK